MLNLNLLNNINRTIQEINELENRYIGEDGWEANQTDAFLMIERDKLEELCDLLEETVDKETVSKLRGGKMEEANKYLNIIKRDINYWDTYEELEMLYG